MMAADSRHVHNWYSATVQGQKTWEAALAGYWCEFARAYGDESRMRAARHRLEYERVRYRGWILGWFWKLVAPIGPGECVPNEVALLIAEEWDVRTRQVP